MTRSYSVGSCLRSTAVLVALMWLGLAWSCRAGGGLPVEPFQAVFTVYRFGFAVGEVSMTLAEEGGGRFSMRSHAEATGLLSLISSEQVDEWVLGEFHDGTPRPLIFRQERTGGESREVILSFDWEQGLVKTSKNGREVTLAVQPRVVDPLTWYLLAMSDLSKDLVPGGYTLVRSDSLKTYRVRRHGAEVVPTPLGDLSTLVITRQREDSDKAIKVWHAPELGLLPVQVAKLEDGEQILRMTIRELKRTRVPGADGDGGP